MPLFELRDVGLDMVGERWDDTVNRRNGNEGKQKIFLKARNQTDSDCRSGNEEQTSRAGEQHLIVK